MIKRPCEKCGSLNIKSMYQLSNEYCGDCGNIQESELSIAINNLLNELSKTWPMRLIYKLLDRISNNKKED